MIYIPIILITLVIIILTSFIIRKRLPKQTTPKPKEPSFLKRSESEIESLCEQITSSKKVNIASLSKLFGLSKEATIKKLRELELAQNRTGYIDNEGNYISISNTNINKLENFLLNKEHFTQTELNHLFE